MGTACDLYLDWHTGSDGNMITTAIAAGSCRPTSPANPPEVYPATLNAMYIETDSASPVSGLVTVDSVEYDIGDTTQGALYDHTSNYEDMVTADIAANTGVMSMGFMMKTNLDDEWEWHATSGMVGSGEWALVAPRYFDSAQHLYMHTSQGYSADPVIIDNNAWYWVTLQYNRTSNIAYLAVYDPSDWSQVGSTVSLALNGSPPYLSYWTVGQHASQGNTEAAYTWYGPVVFDWTDGTFPLLPEEAGPAVLTQTEFQFFEAGDELPHYDVPVPPVVESGDVTESYNNTASGSWDISRPAQATGDLIIMHLVSDANVTHGTLPGGPNGESAVVLAQHVGDAATASTRSSVWYWKATGNNAAGTVTVTPSASEQWRAAAIRVLTGEFDATTPIEYGDVAVATSGAPNIPAFTPTWGYGTAIGYCGVDADQVTGSPSGWTHITNTADRGAMNLGIGVCDTPSVASTQIDGGNFTGVDDGWVSVAYLINAPTHAPVADGRTPLDVAGTDPELDVDTDYGVSVRVENSGSATTEDTYKWQYKLNSGSWTDITDSSSVVKAAATADFANGADVAEYIGGDGTYVTGNNAALDTTGELVLDAVLGAGQSFESHLNFRIVSGDVVDDDAIYLRIVDEAGSAFDSYGDGDTNIPEITVSEGGAAAWVPYSRMIM